MDPTQASYHMKCRVIHICLPSILLTHITVNQTNNFPIVIKDLLTYELFIITFFIFTLEVTIAMLCVRVVAAVMR